MNIDLSLLVSIIINQYYLKKEMLIGVSRVISIFIITILLMGSVPGYAIEESNIITIIDGELVEGGNGPILKDSRLMVPLGVISEKLGYDIQWDSETSTVKIENAEDILQISIGKK